MIKNEQERQRIGQDIAQLRTQRGMTQGDVAERADLLRQHISRIEQGKYSVGFDTLQAIADALDADIRIVPRQ
jgi:transcriptional regulator with XRE-family HTH domain